VRAWRLDTSSKAPYVVFGLVIVLILALAWMWDSSAQQRAARLAAGTDTETEVAEEAAGQVAAGRVAYPVPPLDLPHYHGVGLDAGSGVTTAASDTDASAKEVTGA
jgi:NADH-quinone oxidoreductase subunit H